MTPKGERAPDAGPASKLATSMVLFCIVLTFVLIVLSFPAGLYVVFHGGLSSITYASLVRTYLFIGPIPTPPFTVVFGALFLALLAIYAEFLLLGSKQQKTPLDAVRGAYRTGIGSLASSPLMVIIISIGFLRFSGLLISAVSEAVAGPIGNPFSGADPLLELGSLTFAPLREEIGFRVVLIGLVALVLSMGRPLREALRSLWRPSAAYEGMVVGGAASTIIWLATAASAATFGLCHVNCGSAGGYSWSYLPTAAWGGLVLGYLYVKYGLHVAVLTHWGFDYLSSVFAYFGQAAYSIPINSSTTEYFGQYIVDIDLFFLIGVASFVLVLYLGVKRLAERRERGDSGLIDKGPAEGGGLEP